MTEHFNQEKIFPLKWKGFDDYGPNMICLYEVEFTSDFGIILKGEKFSSISICYEDGVIEAYDSSGIVIIKKQSFKCTPIIK